MTPLKTASNHIPDALRKKVSNRKISVDAKGNKTQSRLAYDILVLYIM